MTDVRRTGPPRRLEDRTRIGIPIAGEADGIWQRAFHTHLAEELRRQRDQPGAEFFGKSMTINPEQVKFYFVGTPESLPSFLDMIEAAIPQANHTAGEERQRLYEAGAEAERKVRDRDHDMELELEAWAERQPA